MKYTMPEMGNRIRTRRRELGIKQYELAERLDISNNHMSSIENGKRGASFEVITNLCEILDVTPDYLFVGVMHSNNVPLSIYRRLRLLDSGRLELVGKIVDILVDQQQKT